MKPRKAVIPVAGLGTRFLPATKAVPKEMLPIVDVPTIQLIVQEVIDSGLSEVIFVTARGKSAIEDHFDAAPELERALEEGGKTDLLKVVRDVTAMAQVVSVRQHEARGLGHAVLAARDLVGNEPFAVLLGDVLMDGPPCTGQLVKVWEQRGAPSIALYPVPDDQTQLYGIAAGKEVEPRLLHVESLVEKPKPGTAPTNLSVLGRYLLPPEIFDILEKTKPGAGGEIQLTDALQVLAKRTTLYGPVVEGDLYDAGTRLGYIRATVNWALKRPALAAELRPALRQLLDR